jgi:hypothetical protein
VVLERRDRVAAQSARIARTKELRRLSFDKGVSADRRTVVEQGSCTVDLRGAPPQRAHRMSWSPTPGCSTFPRLNIFVVFNSVENALVEPFGGTGQRPTFIANREFVPVIR